MKNIPTTGGETCGCTTEETLIVWDCELEDAVECVVTFFFFLSGPRSSLFFLFLLPISAMSSVIRGCGRRRISLQAVVAGKLLCNWTIRWKFERCGSERQGSTFILPSHLPPLTELV